MQTDKQVLYKGRWVSREHFCTFIYNRTSERLVKSYDEFSEAISSGAWFADKKDIPLVDNVDDKVVEIKSKRGRKCQSQQQQ